ncbi:MAG: preprotein translocase subunit SecE [Clostridiales bacterium]|jgi:preprotein translocase subunit SecE|nr:preprotein translocase subunit SecE [Clostridiales bacterium]
MAKKSNAPLKTTTAAVKKTDHKLSFGKRVAHWFRDMRAELKKVIWPSKKEIVDNTSISLAVMVASAVVVWGFDKIAALGISTLIRLVG